MFARNGHRVLRIMSCAAAGGRRPNLDVQRLSLTLPWLLAYDRRDVMMIKAVLDGIEQRLKAAAGHQLAREDGRPESPVAVGSMSVGKLQAAAGVLGDAVDGFDDQIARFDDLQACSRLCAPCIRVPPDPVAARLAATHATALSIYVHCHLVPSAGDQIDGQDLRQWLAQIGVLFFEGYQPSLLDESSESTSQFAPARPRVWLDRSSADGAPHGCDDGRCGKQEKPEGDLKVGHLQAFSWRFLKGFHDHVRTPVGGLALKSRSPSASHGLEIDFSRQVRAVDITSIMPVALYCWSIMILVQQSRWIWDSAHLQVYTNADLDAGWLPDVAGNIYRAVRYAFFALLSGWALIVKWRNDVANRVFPPLPLYPSGKLEYCILWLITGFTQLPMVGISVTREGTVQYHLDAILSCTQANSTLDACQSISVASTHGYFCFVSRVGYLVTFTALCAQEVILSAMHSVAAAAAHRDAWYLFELTEHRRARGWTIA